MQGDQEYIKWLEEKLQGEFHKQFAMKKLLILYKYLISEISKPEKNKDFITELQNGISVLERDNNA